MSARDAILARVRRAGRDSEAAAIADYHPTRHEDDAASRFLERAARLGSDTARARTMAEVPATVARYLDANSLPRRGVCWPSLQDAPWGDAQVALQARAARADDPIGITSAFAAIAETGTLMLVSGAETPATVSLLPETHIAVVPIDRVVAAMEDAWARLREKAGGKLPRAVNFVSGPSRTADVEQTVTLGAHGPRRVLIVLVGNY